MPPTFGVLEELRLAKAKRAYTTRRVNLRVADKLITDDIAPSAGDVVLAKVDRLGQHKRLELTNGRRSRLFVGDEILVAYGNRYAPDQFESVVPEAIAPCHLVAAGGIASKLLSKHSRMKNPTRITPVGILSDSSGTPVNLNRFSLHQNVDAMRKVRTIGVVGTTMNAGKTTTACNLIHGLSKAGLRVGAAKVSGTGAGGDVWYMRDAGAHGVYDFIDAGYASTYMLDAEQVEAIQRLLIQHLCAGDVEVIVLEIADGLYQRETARLLSLPGFRKMVDGIVFAVKDSIGGREGLEWLQGRGLHVMAVSGVVTASPLATRELQEMVDLPVVDGYALQDASVADMISATFSVHDGGAAAAGASAAG